MSGFARIRDKIVQHYNQRNTKSRGFIGLLILSVRRTQGET